MNPVWLYVAATYAAAVWLTRRAGVELPWRIALFFYALVLVFMFTPMTTPGFFNAPVDYTQELPPWSHLSHRPIASNPHMNDVTTQLVPWAHQVRESWKRFDIPLWNHNAGSGYPLLGNAVSAAMSPLRLLALPLELHYSLTAEAAWKILIALTFTFLFCRRRYSELPSCIGAVCFAFSGFIMVWLHFPQSTVAAFAPAVLYDVDRLAERVTPGRFAFSAVMWAAILNGGHPETAAHLGFLAVLAMAWIAFEKREARFIVPYCAAVVAGTLLSAPLVIPFLEGVTKSLRYEMLSVAPHLTGLTDWASTVAMLQPNFFGQQPWERPWGPAIPETICGFISATGIAAAFAMLFHVVAARRWRSREMFFVIGTVIAIGIAYDWPVIADAFNVVFRLAANSRLRFMFVLFVAILAAAVFDLALSERRLALLLGTLCAAALYGATLFFDFPGSWHRDTAVLSLLPAAGVLLALTIAAITPRWRHAALMLVLVATIADSWRTFAKWSPVLPARAMYPQTTMIKRLIELQDASPEPFRIVGYGSVFFPNVAGMYDLQDIRTHDAMAGSRYLALLQVVAGMNRADYFLMWWNKSTAILDYLNVKYYVMSPGNELEDPRFKLVYDGRDGRLWENTAVLPRFFAIDNVILDFNFDSFVRQLSQHTDWAHTAILNELKVENDTMRSDFLTPRSTDAPRAFVTLTKQEHTEYRMKVNAPRYTLITSSIPWWPGWKVTRNGERIDPIRTNGVFLGFAVPAGVSDVRVWYSPASFWVGVWVAVATALALLWAVLSKLLVQPLARNVVHAVEQ